MIITIDGPALSGKTTVGKLLTQKCRYYFLYSGLLYRAVAYVLMKHYAYTEARLSDVAFNDVVSCVQADRLMYRYDNQKGYSIFFDGIDITQESCSPFLSQAASIVSMNEFVRTQLFVMQRSLANAQDSIVDGRDSGSVVFHDAALKIFLTASLEKRAQRFCDFLAQKGVVYTYQAVREDLLKRDKRDQGRLLAPLRPASDAHVIDNSFLTIEETVAKIYSLVEKKRGKSISPEL